MDSSSSTVEQLARDNAERTQRLFKAEVLALISVSKRLLNGVYEYEIEVGDVPSELSQMILYEKVFTRVTDSSPFYQQFQRVFDLHRGEILSTMHSDEWLFDRKISVNIAEGRAREDQAKAANANLHLSWIYSIAKKRRATEADSNFAPRILLHLLRVFKLLAVQDLDREQLEELVVALEKRLGIVRKAPAAQGAGSGTFSRVWDFAREKMKSTGIPVSDDVPAPSEADLSNMLDNLINNKQLNGLLTSMIGIAKEKVPALIAGGGDQGDLGNMFSTFVNQVANDEALKGAFPDPAPTEGDS